MIDEPLKNEAAQNRKRVEKRINWCWLLYVILLWGTQSKMEQQQQHSSKTTCTTTTTSTANHGGGGDAESRKKRDSRAVKGTTRRGGADHHRRVRGDHPGVDSSSGDDEPPEQSKKLRAAAVETTASSSSSTVLRGAALLPTEETEPATSILRRAQQKDTGALVKPESPQKMKSGIGNNSRRTRQLAAATAPMDLEIALQRVVRMNTTNKPSSDEEEVSSRECLSQDCWVNFRIGHAGDASALASCYHESKQQQQDDVDKSTKEPASNNNAEEDTSLEVRLADGLGDEDTPPVIFALIADVSFQSDGEKQASEKSILGAAALLSIDRGEDSRVLNVEWLYVSKNDKLNAVASLLERRMWLRLSALALMTSCTSLVAPNTKNQKTEAVKDDAKTITSRTVGLLVDQQRSDSSSDRL